MSSSSCEFGLGPCMHRRGNMRVDVEPPDEVAQYMPRSLVVMVWEMESFRRLPHPRQKERAEDGREPSLRPQPYGGLPGQRPRGRLWSRRQRPHR